MSTPNRTLSKGTMGLKFMNRVQPKPLISADATPPAPVASTSSAPAKAAPVSAGVKVEKDVKMQDGEAQVAAGPLKVTPSTGPRQIVREGSLLSFPLLSASSSASTSYSYSSMPMTSSVISGRRSFGGANEEIERLNNPTLPPPPSTAAPTDDASQKKKRKKVERDELPLNVRQQPSASSSKGKGSFQANSDKIDLGSGSGIGSGSGSGGFLKKQRTELPQGQFAKPKGFDGAKRGAGAGAKGKRGPDVEPVWGKQGDAREWDVGKDDSEDDSGAFEDGSDSDSDSDDIADLLVTSAAGKSRGDRGKFEDAVGSLFEEAKEPSGADRAIVEAEMQWDDGGARARVATKGPEKKKRRKDQRK